VLSTNSILAYRDTFSLLLVFLKNEKQMVPERLPMSFLKKDLILEFAEWLEDTRGNSLSSRNQRFVILRTFCRWLSTENPEFLKLSEDVFNVRIKKTPKPVMTYLSTDSIGFLLSQPDSSTNEGLRDLTLLALTYDTGARVSEITDLKFKDIRFEAPPIVKLTGKGNKTRIVPLLPQTVIYLTEYTARWKIKMSESRTTLCSLIALEENYPARASSIFWINMLMPEEKATPYYSPTKSLHILCDTARQCICFRQGAILFTSVMFWDILT
jgi:site-specific recombinase XerD